MNNQAIQSAQPGGIIRDPKTPGLHLKVTATGQRSWYLYYRTRAGRERRPKLGAYPLMTIASARQLARQMLLDVAAGRDPSGEVKAQRQSPTVAALIDRYLVEVASRRKTAKEIERLLTRHVRPAIGPRKVNEVRYSDIAELHASMRATPYQANRMLAATSRMFVQAIRYGWRTDNPCRGVELFKEEKRRRYMGVQEAAAIAAALEARRESHPYHVAFLYLLIMTGARVSEIGNARWDHLQGNRLELPDSKTGRPRTVYLPKAVTDVLGTLPRTSGTICGIKTPKKLWHDVRREAGCPDLRLHDLRHSFASAALSAGLTLAQIGELLGHRNSQTTMRYAHLMEDMGTTAVEATAAVISERLKREDA